MSYESEQLRETTLIVDSELRKGGIGDFGGDLPSRLSQQIPEHSGAPLHFRQRRIIRIDQAGRHRFTLQSIDRSINPISSVQKWASSPNLDAAKKGESPVKP